MENVHIFAQTQMPLTVVDVLKDTSLDWMVELVKVKCLIDNALFLVFRST